MKKHPLLFNYILFVNKAYIFISIIILSLFVLTGCNLRINAREEAEDIVATVIEYINKGDSEGLIALFCEEVKENYELTADVDILFNILNKIAVISPEKLKRGCINSANQIILITGGFGASSNSRGQKVYAKNIASGENEVWTRQDIMGIISFDNLPLWAQNKLQQMKNLEHSEDEIEL